MKKEIEEGFTEKITLNRILKRYLAQERSEFQTEKTITVNMQKHKNICYARCKKKITGYRAKYGKGIVDHEPRDKGWR